MKEIDAGIIQQARRGDRIAQRRIYEAYHEYVWVLVYRSLNSRPFYAEEVFQEVFIKIFRALPGFKGDARFSTWVYRITYRTCIDMYRHIRRREELHENARREAETETGQSEDGERALSVEKLLAPLSPQERYLITAREMDGLTYGKLAEITGKSEAALRTALHRIKKRIQKEAPHDLAF